MHKALALAKARAASERGASDEAVQLTSEVLADAARLSWKMRFEALLVREDLGLELLLRQRRLAALAVDVDLRIDAGVTLDQNKDRNCDHSDRNY